MTNFRKNKILLRVVCFYVAVSFIFSSIFPSFARAQDLVLPAPTQFVHLSNSYSLPVLKGLKFNPEKPLQMQFIIDTADQKNLNEQEASDLIKYFLAGLTIPDDQFWVNMSPYEKDKMITPALSETDLGKDMLSQDYILKQLSSSLTYPESNTGKDFWQKTYEEVLKVAHTTKLPVNTFNKIWIMPDKAEVYENGSFAVIAEASLKTMLEQDYLALKNNVSAIQKQKKGMQEDVIQKVNEASSKVMRETILPKINAEVNSGKNFANLRQIYCSLIMAAWFKKKFKESIYRYYINQGKVTGINLNDKDAKDKIYNLYVEAFKKGLYNYVKSDYDPSLHRNIKRQYFSSGMTVDMGNIPHTQIASSSAIDYALAHEGASVAGPLRDVFADFTLLTNSSNSPLKGTASAESPLTFKRAAKTLNDSFTWAKDGVSNSIEVIGGIVAQKVTGSWIRPELSSAINIGDDNSRKETHIFYYSKQYVDQNLQNKGEDLLVAIFSTLVKQDLLKTQEIISILREKKLFPEKIINKIESKLKEQLELAAVSAESPMQDYSRGMTMLTGLDAANRNVIKESLGSIDRKVIKSLRKSVGEALVPPGIDEATKETLLERASVLNEILEGESNPGLTITSAESPLLNKQRKTTLVSLNGLSWKGKNDEGKKIIYRLKVNASLSSSRKEPFMLHSALSFDATENLPVLVYSFGLKEDFNPVESLQDVTEALTGQLDSKTREEINGLKTSLIQETNGEKLLLPEQMAGALEQTQAESPAVSKKKAATGITKLEFITLINLADEILNRRLSKAFTEEDRITHREALKLLKELKEFGMDWINPADFPDAVQILMNKTGIGFRDISLRGVEIGDPVYNDVASALKQAAASVGSLTPEVFTKKLQLSMGVLGLKEPARMIGILKNAIDAISFVENFAEKANLTIEQVLNILKKSPGYEGKAFKYEMLKAKLGKGGLDKAESKSKFLKINVEANGSYNNTAPSDVQELKKGGLLSNFLLQQFRDASKTVFTYRDNMYDYVKRLFYPEAQKADYYKQARENNKELNDLRDSIELYSNYLKNKVNVADIDNFVTNGQGANIMYLRQLAPMVNRLAKELGILFHWEIVDNPTDAQRVLNNGINPNAKNTIWEDMSRSGKTAESCDLLELTSSNKNSKYYFNKRIVWSNGNRMFKLGKALAESGDSDAAVLQIDNTPGNIGGRHMNLKTDMVYGPLFTAFYVIGYKLHSAETDEADRKYKAKEWAVDQLRVYVENLMDANDILTPKNANFLQAISNPASQLAIEAIRKRDVEKRVKPAMVFSSSLKGFATEFFQNANEGGAKPAPGEDRNNNMFSSWNIDSADSLREAVEVFSAKPELYQPFFIIDLSYVELAKQMLRQANELKNKGIPVKVITLDLRWVVPGIRVEEQLKDFRHNLAVQAQATALLQTFVTTFTHLTDQDSNSNPAVKMTREFTDSMKDLRKEGKELSMLNINNKTKETKEKKSAAAREGLAAKAKALQKKGEQVLPQAFRDFSGTINNLASLGGLTSEKVMDVLLGSASKINFSADAAEAGGLASMDVDVTLEDAGIGQSLGRYTSDFALKPLTQEVPVYKDDSKGIKISFTCPEDLSKAQKNGYQKNVSDVEGLAEKISQYYLDRFLEEGRSKSVHTFALGYMDSFTGNKNLTGLTKSINNSLMKLGITVFPMNFPAVAHAGIEAPAALPEVVMGAIFSAEKSFPEGEGQIGSLKIGEGITVNQAGVNYIMSNGGRMAFGGTPLVIVSHTNEKDLPWLSEVFTLAMEKFASKAANITPSSPAKLTEKKFLSIMDEAKRLLEERIEGAKGWGKGDSRTILNEDRSAALELLKEFREFGLFVIGPQGKTYRSIVALFNHCIDIAPESKLKNLSRDSGSYKAAIAALMEAEKTKSSSAIRIFELSKLAPQESSVVGYDSHNDYYYFDFFRNSPWAQKHKNNYLNISFDKDGCIVRLYDFNSPELILAVDKHDQTMEFDYRNIDGLFMSTHRIYDKEMPLVDIGLDENANNGAGAFQFKVTQRVIESIKNAELPINGALSTGMTWKLVTKFEGETVNVSPNKEPVDTAKNLELKQNLKIIVTEDLPAKTDQHDAFSYLYLDPQGARELFESLKDKVNNMPEISFKEYFVLASFTAPKGKQEKPRFIPLAVVARQGTKAENRVAVLSFFKDAFMGSLLREWIDTTPVITGKSFDVLELDLKDGLQVSFEDLKLGSGGVNYKPFESPITGSKSDNYPYVTGNIRIVVKEKIKSESAESPVKLVEGAKIVTIINKNIKDGVWGTAGYRGDKTEPNDFSLDNVRRQTAGFAEEVLERMSEGYFTPINGKTVRAALAYDSRKESDEYAYEMAKVLAAYKGFEVDIIDEAIPTPIAARLTQKKRPQAYDFVFHVTPSHNQLQYGGIKLLFEGSVNEHMWTYFFEKRANAKMEYPINPNAQFKRVRVADELIKEYFNEVFPGLVEKFNAFKRLNPNAQFIVDLMDGSMTTFASLFERLGIKVVRKGQMKNIDYSGRQYELAKGKKVGFAPDPTQSAFYRDEPEYQEFLKSAPDGSIYFLIDGDGDRLVTIVKKSSEAEKVVEIKPNKFGPLAFDYILTNNLIPEMKRLVRTYVTTAGVDAVAKYHGLPDPEIVPVGSKYFNRHFHEAGGLEESGHFVVPGFFDDTIYEMGLILSMMSDTNKDLFTLLDEMQKRTGYKGVDKRDDFENLSPEVKAKFIEPLVGTPEEVREKSKKAVNAIVARSGKELLEALVVVEGEYGVGRVVKLDDYVNSLFTDNPLVIEGNNRGIIVRFKDLSWGGARLSGTGNTGRLYTEGRESNEERQKIADAFISTLDQFARLKEINKQLPLYQEAAKELNVAMLREGLEGNKIVARKRKERAENMISKLREEREQIEKELSSSSPLKDVLASTDLAGGRKVEYDDNNKPLNPETLPITVNREPMTNTPGGIDLGNIGVAASPNSVPVNMPPIDPATFQGLTFRIIKIEPVINLSSIIVPTQKVADNTKPQEQLAYLKE